MRSRHLSSPRFAVSLLAIAALLAACSGKANSPTEMTSQGSSLAVTTDSARGGNGNGGHGGHGPGGHGHPGDDLEFQIHPDVWNLQWANSQGTVQTFVTGPNLSQIDASTAQLTGDGGGAAIHPSWTKLVRHQFMARFTKQDAIGLFPTGKRGQKHTVTLSFTQNGTAVQLTDSIRLVGPAGGAPSTDADD